MRADNQTNINNLPTEKSVKEQVALDITRFQDSFRDKSIGLRKLAEKSGIHQRTLKRLLSQENTPGYQTLIKLYSSIYDLPVGERFLQEIPKVISKKLENKCPIDFNTSNPYSKDATDYMYYDKVFADLYCLASTGPITKDYVIYKFGQSGIETIDQMIELGVLKMSSTETYVPGDKQVEFSPKVIKRVGMNTVEKYSKPDNADLRGKNLIGFFAEGLSEQAYQEWLRIDEEAYYKKISLTKKEGMKGNKKAFTFMATDTYTKE